MKYSKILFLTTLLITGCASTDSGRVFTFSDNIHPETSTLLPETHEKSFTFKISNLQPEEVKSKILLELRNDLSHKFSKQNIPLRKKTDAYDNILNGLKKFSTNNMKLYSTMNWDITTDGLSMSYETIQDFNGRKAIAYQKFKFEFEFDYDSKKSMLSMKVKYPHSYVERNGNLGGESMIIPPFESSQLQEYIKVSFNAVDIKKIGYYKDKTIKGNFVVDYKDDSVYANFIQLGVNNTTERKIDKTANIFLTKGDMQYNTSIHVFPYRDTKSKVIYESYLKSVQWIYSDGTTTFDNFPEKKEIEKMLWDISNG
jgi:hypothetical protein